MHKAVFILTLAALVACQPSLSQSPTATPAAVATKSAPAAPPLRQDPATPPLIPTATAMATLTSSAAVETATPPRISTVTAIATPTSSATVEAAELPDQSFRSVNRTVDAIYIQDNYAYLNVGPIFVILDISAPQSPCLLGAVKLPVETIIDIAVSDGYAYVAAGEAGLRIVDISQPAHPFEVGAYQAPLLGSIDKNYFGSMLGPPNYLFSPGAKAVAINRAGDGQVYAYVAALRAGLRVVNVSDPSRPVEVSALPVSEGGIVDLAIADNQMLYMANPRSLEVGFQAVDISEPTRPRITGSVPKVWGFAITLDPEYNSHAYVAYGSCSSITEDCLGGVHVVDITRPAARETGEAAPLSFGLNLAASRQRVYVIAMNGLDVLNATDPNSPRREKYDYLNPWPEDITIAGDMLYLAVQSRGLQIFDLANPAAPALAGSWLPPE